MTEMTEVETIILKLEISRFVRLHTDAFRLLFEFLQSIPPDVEETPEEAAAQNNRVLQKLIENYNECVTRTGRPPLDSVTVIESQLSVT